jgi:4-aminobutyrate aminotransferase-like enzyme
MSSAGVNDQLPDVHVPPPGPRSRELSRLLAAVEAPGINTLGADDAPALVWSEARGANVFDVDGNRYVDLTAGFGVAAVGHRHPAVVAAVAAQAGRLLHALGDVAAHPARIELARRLAEIAPVDEARVHFAVSGADAVEIALKTALAATGRPGVLAFDPAYHGVTLGALAATSRPAFRAPFAAHLHGHVVRLPFACPPESVADALAGAAIGAVLVEPVVGREGVLVPPPGWLAELAAAARRYGALLVADEIFTGFGRTGDRFAVDADRVRPDLLCCGKALGGGLPIAATVGRRAAMEVWRTRGEALHTGTFVAHPLACAAALASLEVLESENLAVRARRLGASHCAPLARRLAAAAPAGAVTEVRGRGLLWGIELADAALAARLVAACRARGVLLLAGGAHARVVEITPPLTIAAPVLAAALDVVAAALAAPGVAPT